MLHKPCIDSILSRWLLLFRGGDGFKPSRAQRSQKIILLLSEKKTAGMVPPVKKKNTHLYVEKQPPGFWRSVICIGSGAMKVALVPG